MFETNAIYLAPIAAYTNEDCFKRNPCDIRVRNPFIAELSYNLLSDTTPILDSENLSIDNCPQGVPPVIPADYTSIMEVWVAFGYIFYPPAEPSCELSDTGCPTPYPVYPDMSSFFINFTPGSDEIISVKPNLAISWEFTTYFLFYQVGLEIETSYELSMSPSIGTTKITLFKACIFSGPTISPSDNIDYTVGQEAAEIKFTDDVATCLHDISVLNADLTPIDPNLFTYDPDLKILRV